MADHIYEGGWAKTTSTAAAPFGEVLPIALTAGGGSRNPEIREIGIFNNSGAAAEVAIGHPAAIGITPATLTTVQAMNGMDVIAGKTTVATTWGTAPTAPATFMRRATLQTVVGSGVIWVWNPGEFVLWQGSTLNTLVLWQLSTVAVTYDCYIKVAE